MGVHGLWEVLKPASTTEGIQDYFIRAGFERPHCGRVYRLGIDASLWFHQVQSTFAVGHAQSGENPELRTLFFWLARLLRLPIHAIFVFDGPERPAIKRGKRVVKMGHWMVDAMKNFIDAFGYEYCTAPGEAEAELAALNQLGFVDGVLTDDGDAFLFGAQTVIRNFNAKAQQLIITEADAVWTHDAVALGRWGMILIALFAGGDYNKDGLPGFGQRVAHGLARYGFGDTLCKAVRELEGETLRVFLSGWRSDLRHALCTDDQKLLGRRYPELSKRIPDTFPDLDIVDLYARPVTSAFEDYEMSMPHPPDIAELGRLCERYFSWGTASGIVDRFGSCLIPGILTRVLINLAINRDRLHSARDPFVVCSSFAECRRDT
ncbi:PIN domain-like protein [Fomitopsis serialis]|uniref:PIN domain-like protein n=1 Tax=Fomitopsis serialis TaxID=139415 RepID=UPI002007A25F|nr:PIN domain-like protein [Neoantrodia serialis]KAH9913405.1 PIN domain-like protein [Neoantrodia serialis]